jgi:ribosomal protein L30/L7E
MPAGEVQRLTLEALGLHRQGRLAEAEAIYILNDNPDHADSLQLLGSLSLQLGCTDEAIGSCGEPSRSPNLRPKRTAKQPQRLLTSCKRVS